MICVYWMCIYFGLHLMHFNKYAQEFGGFFSFFDSFRSLPNTNFHNCVKARSSKYVSEQSILFGLFVDFFHQQNEPRSHFLHEHLTIPTIYV